jgi:hypothetical protein
MSLRDRIMNVMAPIVSAVAVALLALLSGYLLFVHFVGSFLVITRETYRAHALTFSSTVLAGVFFAIIAATLFGVLYAAHALAGWFLAGPLAAIAAYVIVRDLTAPVIYKVS